MPRRIGDRVGRLIGAPEGTVVIGDTLSIKVYQALASALELNPARRVILSRQRQLSVRPLHRRRPARGRSAGTMQLQDRRSRRRRGRHRRDHRGGDADRGRLPHRPPARHEGVDAQGARRRRADDLGPGAFGRRDPGRPVTAPAPISRSAAPTNISTAVPARRPSSMSRLVTPSASGRPCRDGWGIEAPFAFDLDYRAGRRHRAHAGRHAAGHRDGRARCGARCLGRRQHARCARAPRSRWPTCSSARSRRAVRS